MYTNKRKSYGKVRSYPIMDQEKGNYKVSYPILEHNHILHLPQISHLMVSQRKISKLQGFEIEITDDAGIRPKAANGLPPECLASSTS
jgi:hypothetical protein